MNAVSGCGTANARTQAPGATSTVIFTVSAPRESVWRTLADIEALPRWAGEFCGGIGLVRGRWVALTTLGELECELEAHEVIGEITLRFGAGARAAHTARLCVAAALDESAPAGGTRVTLVVTDNADGDAPRARLADALRVALAEWLVRRPGGAVNGRSGW